MDSIKEFIHLLPDFVVILTLISTIVLTYFQGFRQGYKARDDEFENLWKNLEPSLHDYFYKNPIKKVIM